MLEQSLTNSDYCDDLLNHLVTQIIGVRLGERERQTERERERVRERENENDLTMSTWPVVAELDECFVLLIWWWS